MARIEPQRDRCRVAHLAGDDQTQQQNRIGFVQDQRGGRPAGMHQLEQNRRLADELATRLRVSGDDLVHGRLHRLARSLELRMFGPQAQLSQALAVGLGELGLEACAVSELSAVQGQLKLAFGFDTHTSQPQMLPFDSGALVPETLKSILSASSVVLPLKYGEEALGIAALPIGERDGIFYETLAEVFGVGPLAHGTSFLPEIMVPS